MHKGLFKNDVIIFGGYATRLRLFVPGLGLGGLELSRWWTFPKASGLGNLTNDYGGLPRATPTEVHGLRYCAIYIRILSVRRLQSCKATISENISAKLCPFR